MTIDAGSGRLAEAMARPWRIELPRRRYHVTARGNERRDIFRDDRDRQHFLELLAALPERFGARVHAYVLMPNHYHLLLETPEANLSRTAQWLTVSCSVPPMAQNKTSCDDCSSESNP